ncbi:MAG TPA: hypothetical protein VGJ56_26890 [Reyranella sp.]
MKPKAITDDSGVASKVQDGDDENLLIRNFVEESMVPTRQAGAVDAAFDPPIE